MPLSGRYEKSDIPNKFILSMLGFIYNFHLKFPLKIPTFEKWEFFKKEFPLPTST